MNTGRGGGDPALLEVEKVFKTKKRIIKNIASTVSALFECVSSFSPSAVYSCAAAVLLSNGWWRWWWAVNDSEN